MTTAQPDPARPYGAPPNPDVEILEPDEISATTAPRSLIGMAESRLLDLAEDGKAELVKSFDGLVAMVHEIAANVESSGGSAVAGYARQAAHLLGDFQAGLRDRPVDELLEDGRELIRRSPGVAIGVALVAGFIAARLFKSGSRQG